MVTNNVTVYQFYEKTSSLHSHKNYVLAATAKGFGRIVGLATATTLTQTMTREI